VSRHSWPWERRDLSAKNAESAERTKRVGYILLFAPPTPARSAVYTFKQGVVHRVPITKMVGVLIIFFTTTYEQANASLRVTEL